MEEPPSRRVGTPSPADVLLGRGRPFQSHPGNQRMLQLIGVRRPQYLERDRRGKNEIIMEVIRTVKELGGRFLRRVDYEQYWTEAEETIVYRKVGHAFRSTVRRQKDERLYSFSQETGRSMLSPPDFVASTSTLPAMPLVQGVNNAVGQLGMNASSRQQQHSSFNSALNNMPRMLTQNPTALGISNMRYQQESGLFAGVGRQAPSVNPSHLGFLSRAGLLDAHPGRAALATTWDRRFLDSAFAHYRHRYPTAISQSLTTLGLRSSLGSLLDGSLSGPLSVSFPLQSYHSNNSNSGVGATRVREGSTIEDANLARRRQLSEDESSLPQKNR